jgi:hypothetical protein
VLGTLKSGSKSCDVIVRPQSLCYLSKTSHETTNCAFKFEVACLVVDGFGFCITRIGERLVCNIGPSQKYVKRPRY